MMTRPLRSLVLGYHTVSRHWENSVAVRPHAMEAQLELVLQAGYTPVTFTRAVLEPERQVVAVTFDDAFLAVHEVALPLLDRLGMTATVFAPTGFMTAGRTLLWDGYDTADGGNDGDRAAMSWEHLRDLVDRGWEVGSHTRTHPHLPRLDDATLREELLQSRADCTAGIGRPCTSLAYPYGEVDQRVRDAAAAAGYTAAAALGPQRRREDPLWWPRTGVYRGDDLRRFRLKLLGLTRSRAFAAGIGASRRLAALRA